MKTLRWKIDCVWRNLQEIKYEKKWYNLNLWGIKVSLNIKKNLLRYNASNDNGLEHQSTLKKIWVLKSDNLRNGFMIMGIPRTKSRKQLKLLKHQRIRSIGGLDEYMQHHSHNKCSIISRPYSWEIQWYAMIVHFAFHHSLWRI